MRAEAILLYSDMRRINIPFKFCSEVTAIENTSVNAARRTILDEGVNGEHYWDCWHTICQEAIITGEQGRRYDIHQDGDCWLIPHKCDIKWVPDVEEISYEELENRYEESLNDCNPPVRIGSLTYEPGYVLKEVDPVAFRCGACDYIDSLLQDADIFEYNGNYYKESAEEPDDFIESFFDGGLENGHWEWKTEEARALEKRNAERMRDDKTWAIEFEKENP